MCGYCVPAQEGLCIAGIGDRTEMESIGGKRSETDPGKKIPGGNQGVRRRYPSGRNQLRQGGSGGEEKTSVQDRKI